MSVREKDHPDLFRRIQEQNLLRQYDLLSNCIEIGLAKGIEAFDKYTLWALNYAAVSNIAQFGGRYREEPIYVGTHIPPHFQQVPHLMDLFFSFIHENWTVEFGEHPTALAAYALWRLSWIHPFVEGNGRTARAACYYLICIKQGRLLTGRKTVPERIRENHQPYYEALRAADRAWDAGHLDVSRYVELSRRTSIGATHRKRKSGKLMPVFHFYKLIYNFNTSCVKCILPIGNWVKTLGKWVIG